MSLKVIFRGRNDSVSPNFTRAASPLRRFSSFRLHLKAVSVDASAFTETGVSANRLSDKLTNLKYFFNFNFSSALVSLELFQTGFV